MKQEILQITKNKVKEKLEKSDQKIINLSLIVEKLQLKINELTELLKIISDQEYPSIDQILGIKDYCKFYLLEDKSQISTLNFKEEEEIKKIEEYNIGITVEKDVKEITNKLCRNILELIDTKEKIDLKIDTLIKENYINLYNIATPKIACKMIEIAGSFERLSRYPASTIQLLGSEKSFFKALKFNKKTPKYGILYNHPLIINLTNKKKAKIARSLASKIALGLKADVEKKDISKDLINKIKTKISEINE
jgi:RNA processing factor Prp31